MDEAFDLSVAKIYPKGLVETAPETSSAPVVDLSQELTRLRSDLENVQRELDQAVNVWRSALITEKKELQSLFQEKQLAWSEQESAWQKQRLAYEQKIQELETFFKTQLTVREQHALQALNELDDSWQRDKLLWDQSTSRRLRELEQREALWQTENQKQESRIQELQDKIVELESQDRPTPEPAPAASPTTMESGDYVEPDRTEQTIQSLEQQVSTLDAMIRLVVPESAHPQRRKTDWL